MVKILSVLGHQDANDLSFITDESVISYHASLSSSFVNHGPTSKLRSMFRHTSSGLMDLLEDMLTYNPSLRRTTQECLRSPIFDHIRIKEYEKHSPISINLKIYEEGGYDYDENKDHKYEVDDFKKMILEEVKLI